MFKKTSFLILLTFCLLLSSCSSKEPVTSSDLKPLDPSQLESFKNDEDDAKYIEKRFDELKKKWDPKNSDGEIAKLNNTRSNSHLSEETINLLLNCISLSEKTDGLFDITLYPMTRLWGFEDEDPKIPQDMLVALLISKCGMDTISVSNNMFTLDQFTMLDPSAVTNGYAADLISSELAEKGCKSALIEFGDHVRTVGSKDDGKKWNISLKNPADGTSVCAAVSVDGGVSVSTKGAFQNYFEEDGKRYCDIFDPKNGNPVDNDLASVTVISTSGIASDAYATACFVMGSKDAEKFFQKNDGFEIVLFLNNGEIHASEGIAGSLLFTNPDQEVKVIKK